MSEYYCPFCGADIGEQLGFDPDAGYWTCTECGKLLYDPKGNSDEPARFEGIDWFCDNCGAFLNAQSGFSDWLDTWTCTKCGHVNSISENDIYESEEALQRSKADTNNDNIEEDTDYENEEDYTNDYDEEELTEFQHSDIEQHYKASKKREKRREQRKRLWRFITRKKQAVGISFEQCKHLQYSELISFLRNREFYKIKTSSIEDLSIDALSMDGVVASVSINNMETFDATSEFPYNSQINIVYHSLKRKAPPLTSKRAKHKHIDNVITQFRNAEFQNLYKQKIPDLKTGWLVKENSVEKVTINGKENYKRRDQFRIDAKIVISYHTFKNS